MITTKNETRIELHVSDMNFLDDSILNVLLFMKSNAKDPTCSGFRGKGRMEQETFFYNPNRPRKILDVKRNTVSICLNSDDLNEGDVSFYVKINYENGNTLLSDPTRSHVLNGQIRI